MIALLMKPTVLILSAALAGTVLLQTACDKSESGGGPTESVGADGVRIIKLTGNDTLQYNIKEITATPGEKLNIELTNVGSMPKLTMAHNFLLLQAMPDADVNALAMTAASKPPEYLPDDQSKIIARTKMLGPGEKDMISITAPAGAGSYPFLCTFPGHFTLMRGNLIVKAK